MTFKLNTSGRVRAAPNAPHAANWYCWSDLTPFAQGYVEAMFRTHVVGHSVNGFGPLGFSDLAPETLARIIADCEAVAIRSLPGEERARGGKWWASRQAGDWPDFPPLTLTLGEDGKVRFA